MSTPSAANSEGVVNIVIKATDRSAAALKGAGEGVNQLGQKVGDLSRSFTDFVGNLSKSTMSEVDIVLGRIGSIGRAFDVISNIMSSDEGSELIRMIEEQADDALYATTSLSQGLKDLAAAATPAVETFAGLDGKMAQIGSSLGRALGDDLSKKLQEGFASSLDAFDDFTQSAVEKAQQFKAIGDAAGGVGDAAGLVAGADEPLEIFGDIQNATTGAVDGINNVLQRFSIFSIAISTLKGAVMGGPFELLIGQNVRLREQLLATQSSLVSTNKIFLEGQQIKDPTTAIQALTAPVNDAIERIRKGSLDLVGVTSGQLIDSFQIVAGQASQIGINLSQASDLTLSFAAAMGTLGIPLFQARQEITSIASGTIDMNSVLAKSLGITNQMVLTWKAQGTTFEQLTKRMEAFKAGNALAAKTISGVTSNIQEVFDEIGRRAGEPLLDPIVKHLDGFYQYLKDNMESLSSEISKIVQTLFTAGEGLLAAFMVLYQAFIPVVSQLPTYLAESLSSFVRELATAIKAIVPIFQSALNVLTEVIKRVSIMGGPLLQLAIQAKVLQVAVSGLTYGFGSALKILPGVGEILFLMKGRTADLVKGFFNLSGFLGHGAAGFLTLGKNMQMIPGIAGILQKKFGVLAPVIQQFAPKFAGIAMQVAALSKGFAPAGEAAIMFTQKMQGSLGAAADFAEKSNFGGGILKPFAQSIRDASEATKPYVDNIKNASFFNEKFAEVTKAAVTQTKGQLLSFGLMGVGLFAGIFILDKFVLSNKNFMKTLEEVGKVLQQIGIGIWTFLTNPFVMATGVVVSLGLAIKAGLIPQILAMAQAFTGAAAQAVTSWWETATTGVRSFSESIKSTNLNVVEFFSQTEASLKKQASTLKSSLQEQSASYESAILERQAQIQALSAEIDEVNAVPQVDKDNPFLPPLADVDEMQAQRQSVQTEMDAMVSEREAQITKLAGLEEQIYKKDLHKASDALRTQLASEAELYDQAIAQRTAQIEELNQQITDLDSNAPDPNDPFAAPDTDQSMALEGQKQAIQADLDEMMEARQAQVQTLAGMEADIAKMGPPPTVGERFTQLGQTIKTTTVSSFEQLKTTVKGFSWQSTVDGMNSVKNGAIASGKAIKANLVGSFKNIMADVGPMILMVGAIVAITEAVGTYTTLMDASTKNSKAFAESTKEATEALNLLLDSQNKASALDSGKPREGERLKEIIAEKGVLTKVIDFLRGALNGLIKVAFILLNPFAALRVALEGASSLIAGLWSGIKGLPILGDLAKGIEGLAVAMGDALEPVKAFFQPVLDLLGRFGAGVKNVWDFLTTPPQFESSENSQLYGEIEGYTKMLEESEGKLAKMTASTNAVTAARKNLMDLSNQQAAARAKGDDSTVAALQVQIDKSKEILDARKAEADAFIKGLESQKAPTDIQKKAQSQLIDKAKELKRSWEDNAVIKPPDLAELGSASDQIASKANAAVTTVKKMLNENSGAADQFKQKTQELLDMTAQQLQTGAITSQEAIARYRLIATSTKVDQEQQIKAQQAITDAYKTEGDLRVAEVQKHMSQVEALVAQGTLGEAESERQTTEMKRQELEIRLENLRIAHDKEQEIRYQNLQTDLSTQDELIKAAQEKLKEPTLKPSDKKDQTDAIEAANKKKLELQTGYGNARNFADTKFANESQSITTDLAKNEAETLKNANEEKLKNYDEAQTALEALKSQGLKTDEEFAQESKKNNDARFKEELDQIAAQREKLDPKDKEGLEALAAKESEIRKKMADSRNSYYDDMTKAAQDDAQEEIAALEGLKAEGLKTDEEFAQGSLDITRKRLQAELVLLAEQKKLLDPKDEEGLQKIAAKEAGIQKEIANLRNTFYEQMITAAKADAQERTAILEGQKVAGLLNEKDYNQQSFALATEALDKELALLEQKKGELKAGDEEGQEAIAAQEADIQKRRLEVTKDFYQKQLAVSERARQKLLDAATEAETESQIQIQELLNAGAIKQSEAEDLKLSATEDRIQSELRLEEQKLAELSAMPSYSDPEAEDERQQQIRASRQRTHELTLQVVENEYNRQEKIRAKQEKALDAQAQRIANAAEGQTQAWSAQSVEIENINRSLDLQNKILESGKNYLEARSSLISTELGVLSQISKSQSEQKDIAKLKAAIEIRVLDIKQKGELQALKLQQEQTANALKREEIENRIAQIKNQADVAQKVVNLQKLALNPEATAEERQAAQLDLQASLQTGGALQEAGTLVRNQQAAQVGLDRNELASLRMKQRGETISARGAFVETLEGGSRRAATEALKNQILRDLGLGLSGSVSGAAQAMASNALASYFGMPTGRGDERVPGNFSFADPSGRRSTAPRSRFPNKDAAPSPGAPVSAPKGSPQSLPSMPIPGFPTTGMPTSPRNLLPPVNLTGQGRSPDFSAVTASNEKLVTAIGGLKSAFEDFGQINFSQDNQINNTYQTPPPSGARGGDQVLSTLYDVATKIRQARR